jgi:mxaL protein
VKVRQWLSSVFDRESLALLLALGLLLLALLMPQIPIRRATYDYIVVFDISQSMSVMDYEIDRLPVSRLQFAREAVKRALPELPCGSRVGWGAFVEYRTLLLLAPIEVCANFNDLLTSLERIDGRMRWGNRSEIAKGVNWALRAVKDSGNHSKVVFLTDGHEAPPLNEYTSGVLNDVERGAIGGWLVGVGGFTPQPIPRTDDNGKSLGFWRITDVIQLGGGAAASGGGFPHEHLSELREAHLRSMARQIGFDYTRLVEPASLIAAMKHPRFAERVPVATNVFWLPALGALLVLGVRFLPRRRSTRSY